MGQIEWESLRTRYPDWRIRESVNGRCLIATRLDRFALSDRELFAGLYMTLVEDSPDRLTKALASQTEIERTL